jgi:hypothetical protein
MSKQFHGINTHLQRDLAWGSSALECRRWLPDLAEGTDILLHTIEGRSRSMGDHSMDSIDVAVITKHGLYKVSIVVIERHVFT